ncbi:hypothetical protein ZWY2020_015071 [Hordeum vulgare]|nr:hypothetical protein ZWY2020_015071 [Hordeum vulgare]
MAPPGSRRWAYVRIMADTILGGGLGFYVMHRIETSYKVRRLPSHQPTAIWSKPRCSSTLSCRVLRPQTKMKERLRRYEAHLLAKEKEAQQLQDEGCREDQAQLLPDS